jgi:hypothetical protein
LAGASVDAPSTSRSIADVAFPGTNDAHSRGNPHRNATPATTVLVVTVLVVTVLVVTVLVVTVLVVTTRPKRASMLVGRHATGRTRLQLTHR